MSTYSVHHLLGRLQMAWQTKTWLGYGILSMHVDMIYYVPAEQDRFSLGAATPTPWRSIYVVFYLMNVRTYIHLE